jgi:hypothetical protein
MRLMAAHTDSREMAPGLRPYIPLVENFAIALRDEFELETMLDWGHPQCIMREERDQGRSRYEPAEAA